ncbi:serine/threonine-protein kinase KIN2, partial [Ascosphaera acerosa]
DDLARPVYLKGLFSVSTTSTKSFSFIRADIKRVLGLLGVQYTDIKGGFSCRKVPSIEPMRHAASPARGGGHAEAGAATGAGPGHGNGNGNGGSTGSSGGSSEPQSPSAGHRHRISFAGLRGGNNINNNINATNKENSGDATTAMADASPVMSPASAVAPAPAPTPTPASASASAAPELKHSRSIRRHNHGPPDRSFITNSEGSEEFLPTQSLAAALPPISSAAPSSTAAAATAGAAGGNAATAATTATTTTGGAAETTTRIRDDKHEGNMVLRFEVLIVKVPLFSLHGIQFKKVSGGMWQYREMAKKILDELRL